MIGLFNISEALKYPSDFFPPEALLVKKKRGRKEIIIIEVHNHSENVTLCQVEQYER